MGLALPAQNASSFTVAPTGNKVAMMQTESPTFLSSTANTDEEVKVTPETTKDKTEKKVESKKTENKNKKDGVFTPVVKGVRAVVGEELFTKLKYKGIGLHTDVIKNFVGTSDSEFGQFVLLQLFAAADKDNNGTIEVEELEEALNKLGFDFLRENQVKSLFKRADKDGNGSLDLEEFMKVAPKTLEQNLVKKAKNTGGDLGLLS